LAVGGRDTLAVVSTGQGKSAIYQIAGELIDGPTVYMRLGAADEELGRPVVLALTATAAPPVREEIARRLRLREPEVVLGTLDRPNIRFAVELFHDGERKDEALLDRAVAAPKPASSTSPPAEAPRSWPSAVNRLEDAGAVDVRAGGEVAATAAGGDPREAVDAAVRAQERREALEASRLEMMRSYAELRDGCRREFVLNYFGEDYRDPCGRCENCEAGRVAERRGDELPFDVGSRVAHREWGGGVVHGFDDGRVTVLFDEVRYRTLALELVEARDLLAAEEA
jgi:superfamily II DNA helicase RecQ